MALILLLNVDKKSKDLHNIFSTESYLLLSFGQEARPLSKAKNDKNINGRLTGFSSEINLLQKFLPTTIL